MQLRRSGIILLLGLLLSAGPAGAALVQSDGTCPERSVRTVRGLRTRIATLEASPDGATAERCELAELLLLSGRGDEAATILGDILEREPGHLGATLALARVRAHDELDAEVVALLERARDLAPASPDVQVQWAEHVEERRDPNDALPLFEAVVAEHPEDVDALVGTARVLFRLRRDSVAHVLLDRALAVDPSSSRAHLLRSELFERALDDESRAAAANRAVACDSLNADAQLAVSRILRQGGQIEAAYERLLAVLAFDPTHLETHRVLGNGGSVKSWGRYPQLEDDEVPPELAPRLDRADSLLLVNRWDEAEDAFAEVREIRPTLVAGRLGLASVAYYRGDYEDAYEQFLDIAADFPGLGVAHYGLTQAMIRIRQLRDPRNREALQRFHAIPRPPEPERLRDVFVDFDRMDDDLQKIVLLSVTHLSDYIPVAAVAGNTYRLLRFHQRLWELPANAGSRGRRTFDGRLWDDVKGQGGRDGVAGEEWTREVTLERYNVLSHEFMHQIHRLLLPEQQEAVDSLYATARRERRTLDAYADSNPAEYIAQVYEAFISPTKDPRLGGTSGNTRSRLLELDPAAYGFMERIDAQPSYRPHAIQALRTRFTRELALEPADLQALERETAWVLARYGEHEEVVSMRAGLARLAGDDERAVRLHARAIELAPDRLEGYAELADDAAVGRQDFARAAAVIESYLERHGSSHEAWVALASYRLAEGNVPAARDALGRAADLGSNVGGRAAEELCRAELARLEGRPERALRAYREIVEGLDPSNVRARAELALLSIEDGRPDEADQWLRPVRSGAAADVPIVQEAEARLLAASGRDGAVERLVELRADHPGRLETITALISVARRTRPALVPSLVADGLSLISQRPPAESDWTGERFEPGEGRLTARVVADFEKEAER